MAPKKEKHLEKPAQQPAEKEKRKKKKKIKDNGESKEEKGIAEKNEIKKQRDAHKSGFYSS